MTAVVDSSSPTPDPTQPIEADQSLGELMGRMSSDLGALVSTQIELAKVEIKDEVARAGKGVGMLGGGGLAGWFALLLVSMGIAVGIGNAMESVGWGFVLVGLVTGLFGALSQGGAPILLVILAVALTIGALISWLVVAATRPTKLGRGTALAIGAVAAERHSQHHAPGSCPVWPLVRCERHGRDRVLHRLRDEVAGGVADGRQFLTSALQREQTPAGR